MKQRILSGAILIVFLAAVVVFNHSFPLALNIAVALISALAVYELIKAMGMHRRYSLVLPSLLTAAAVPLFLTQEIGFVIYGLFTAAVFCAFIASHKKTSFQQIAVVYSMVVMIPMGLSSLITLRQMGERHGMFYVLVAILAAWVADAGAYFAGTFFGKHKLCPQISPKKTVEGAVGGAVVNMLVMLLFGFLFQYALYHSAAAVNFVVLAGIGLFGSMVSILGDLSFSLIKRSCNIKDFGQVIPGHGGILDRFDSVIFTAPFVYILVSYFPIVVQAVR